MTKHRRPVHVAYTAHGRRCGESHPRAKYSDVEVDTMRWLHEQGLSYAEIAAKWDDELHFASVHTVRAICEYQRRVVQATHSAPAGASNSRARAALRNLER